jgi:hypothetical protein
MTEPVGPTIPILTQEDEEVSRGDRTELVTRLVNVETLRDKLRQFMAGLQGMLEDEPVAASPFQLMEVEFSAEITGNGEFKLLGSGIGVEAKGAVKFVLRRTR